MVAHTFNSSSSEAEAGESQEFEARLADSEFHLKTLKLRIQDWWWDKSA